MERLTVRPRDNWQERVESLGFGFHTVDPQVYGDATYWDESCAYRFTAEQVDTLDDATATLYDLCLDLVDRVVHTPSMLEQLRIPEGFWPLLAQSWKTRDHDLIGRFDLCYNPAVDPQPKLLEFNADTPTSLFEAGVVQWFWLQEMMEQGQLPAGSDQFNQIHEHLEGGLTHLHKQRPDDTMYFTCHPDSVEDVTTTEYVRDIAGQVGITTEFISIGDIGWNNQNFTDLDEKPITWLFKLYPWEWLTREDFGQHIAHTTMQWFEPPWKMILSNKGILPLLWAMFPDHPNLLPADFDPPPSGVEYVKKPLFSREGENLIIPHLGIETAGSYGAEGHVYQQFCPLPEFSGRSAVVGSWIIAGRTAGIGIREDNGPVTRNSSRFVPHFFTP